MLRTLAVVFTLTCIVPRLSASDRGPQSSSAQDALETVVPSVELKSETILDGVAELTKSDSGITFAFEEPLRREFSSEPSLHPRFSVSLHRYTIRQVLDELCKWDPQYTWVRDGDMINLYPRHALDQGASYLLNRTLNDLRFTKVANAQDAVFEMVKQLPPPFEQIAITQPGGNISYGEAWTAEYSSLTVRQALNKIALQINRRSAWIFGGSKDFRTVMFYTGQLHALQNMKQ